MQNQVKMKVATIGKDKTIEHILLVDIWNNSTVENSLSVPQNISLELLYDLAIWLYIQDNEEQKTQTNIFTFKFIAVLIYK